MTLLLGIDTGGTYTDAVLIEDESHVIASAKSLTTREDLAIGIDVVVRDVLKQGSAAPTDVSLASLSTTLATNALVEGQGGRVGLVYIGFDPLDLEAHGLKDALKGDPVLALAGGHDHSGMEVARLNEGALCDWLAKDQAVSAFAVAAQFATRNPFHEQRVTQIIQDVTGHPVSASHHLSSKLNGPKRALTTLLNARLIGLTHKLIGRAEGILLEIGINVPLMVVRGDGALIAAATAKERPIETILSGPAASIVGARWLTGLDHALVSDIGGTTTDIALLRDGRPQIDTAGAQVGPYRTMVEAVAVRTSGLGGDSEVHFVLEGLSGGVKLGPKRVLPLSLMAHEAPDVVLPALAKQMCASMLGEFDGMFVRALSGIDSGGLNERDIDVLGRIGHRTQPLGEVLKTRMEASSLRRLVERGLVQVGGLTPSDASHALGGLDLWNHEAAIMGLKLFGRRRTGSSDQLAVDPLVMAKIIVDRLTYQTGQSLLSMAFAAEETAYNGVPIELAQNELLQRGLARESGLVKIEAGLNVDIIGLGASASMYYPAVAKALHCKVILPENAGVANAIGAVVGRIKMRRSGTVTSPSEGVFRVHFTHGPKDFVVEDDALTALKNYLILQAETDARDSGCENIQTRIEFDIRRTQVESSNMFIEATVSVESSGRPRVSD